ncbi:hypothetical protein EVAR_11438_1 [Eumeta japonica]|uniref:Uncharacterized protein n=1 Tax=Eumeta variegata TaxID=151549 RepID=A0A4C1TNH4_EUMVA|nr:hypothetical protein EVAR_11438_1 [Eumeta japonica]
MGTDAGPMCGRYRHACKDFGAPFSVNRVRDAIVAPNVDNHSLFVAKDEVPLKGMGYGGREAQDISVGMFKYAVRLTRSFAAQQMRIPAGGPARPTVSLAYFQREY